MWDYQCHGCNVPIQVIKQSLVTAIPEEPAANAPDMMSRLRVRCPDGQLLNRRFLGKHVLQDLLNYLHSKGFDNEEYKVLTTYPRRDVSAAVTKKFLLMLMQALTTYNYHILRRTIGDCKQPMTQNQKTRI